MINFQIKGRVKDFVECYLHGKSSLFVGAKHGRVHYHQKASFSNLLLKKSNEEYVRRVFDKNWKHFGSQNVLYTFL